MLWQFGFSVSLFPHTQDLHSFIVNANFHIRASIDTCIIRLRITRTHTYMDIDIYITIWGNGVSPTRRQYITCTKSPLWIPIKMRKSNTVFENISYKISAILKYPWRANYVLWNLIKQNEGFSFESGPRVSQATPPVTAMSTVLITRLSSIRQNWFTLAALYHTHSHIVVLLIH